MLIGIDEVGRGCLAGDVLACAFARRENLSAREESLLLATALDSKAFSSRRRREEAAAVVARLGQFALGRAGIAEIESLNIRGATLLAMRRAWEALTLAHPGDHPGLSAARVVIDGKDVPPGLPEGSLAVIGGDANVPEISCASIIAKVARDREMAELDAQYPGYGLARNAGYGSAEHRAALGRLGMSPVHRSWAAKFVLKQAPVLAGKAVADG